MLFIMIISNYAVPSSAWLTTSRRGSLSRTSKNAPKPCFNGTGFDVLKDEYRLDI
jgi:hypothetical protein